MISFCDHARGHPHWVLTLMQPCLNIACSVDVFVRRQDIPVLSCKRVEWAHKRFAESKRVLDVVHCDGGQRATRHRPPMNAFRVFIEKIATLCLNSTRVLNGVVGTMTETGERNQEGGLARDIFAGIGLGGALGMIVGLSVTPVVSVVVGGLTSLLAVFLGLQGGSDAPAALKAVRLNGARIGGFGLALAAGVLAGLFIRTTEPFQAPIEVSVAAWVDAGYPVERARELVVFERTGILPGDETAVEPVAEQLARSRSTVLFSDESEINLCRELNPNDFGRDVSEGLITYRLQDNDTLNRLADAVEAMPADAQMPALDMLGQMFCDLRGAAQ